MAELITRAEYAARRGVSRAAVTKAVKAGRISLIDGKIDPVVADIQWERNTDKAQASRANGGKLKETERVIDAAVAGLAESGDVKAAEYMVWKARREKSEALRSELEYAQKAGNVYDKATVDRASRTAGRMLRDQILAVPSRLAAEIANLSDPQAIELRMRDELRQALTAVERMSTTVEAE